MSTVRTVRKGRIGLLMLLAVLLPAAMGWAGTPTSQPDAPYAITEEGVRVVAFPVAEGATAMGAWDPSVTPSKSSTTEPLNQTGSGASFVVSNTGSSTETYNLTCQVDGTYVTGCNVPPPTQIDVDGGSMNPVLITFATGSQEGSGWLKLTATETTWPFTSDSGQMTVIVEADAGPPSVTPDGTTRTFDQEVSSGTESFTVTNQGTQQGTFSLDCQGVPIGGSVMCSDWPSSVTVSGGASESVTVTYSAVDGTADLQLTATRNGESDTGHYEITVNEPPPPLEPGTPVVTGGSSITIEANRSGSASFSVQNPGDTTGTYTFSCSVSSPVTGCTAPGNQDIGAGSTVNLSVSVTAGGVTGTGSVTLTATLTDDNTSDSDQVAVTVEKPAGTPIVNHQEPNPHTVVEHTVDTLTFGVTNPDNLTHSYKLTCNPYGDIQGTTCVVLVGNPSSHSIAANSTSLVEVQYEAPEADATGYLRLDAVLTTNTAGKDDVAYTINGIRAPAFTLLDMNPGELLDRPSCYSFPAGPEGLVQCGELSLSHAMPTFRSLGRGHTLALAYANSTARPHPIVMADIELAEKMKDEAGDTISVDSVRVRLITGTDTIKRWYDGAPFDPEKGPARVALGMERESGPISTGIHEYELEVSLFTGADPCPGPTAPKWSWSIAPRLRTGRGGALWG